MTNADQATTFAGVARLETGIAGFDHIAMGGLPSGRATLVTGTAGSAKTVFAAQFLAEGVRRGQPGVFVTFEESADDIRRNMVSVGFDIAAWEAEGLWQFVDASPLAMPEESVVGDYDLAGLMARIGHAVDATAAERIAIDAVGSIVSLFADAPSVRAHLRRLVTRLRRLGLTVVMTVESSEEYGSTVGRYGVEEFVVDNVIVLRNALEEEKRRRTIEILKMRGTMHRKGEYPFTIRPGEGIVVIPLSVLELAQPSSDVRISSGNDELDAMTGGGFFRDAVLLVSGATGTGKTLLVTEFLAGGVAAGERCLLFAFEESRDQLFRNAAGWGRDFESAEASGLLRVCANYPETASLEDHLVAIKSLVDEYRPTRIAVDSLSALERVGSRKAFREFLIGLTSYIKSRSIAAVFTATTPTLLGGSSVTEGNISTLTDSIIVLRYVEVNGEIRRGITVLKMRGSQHDRSIHEFAIDGHGMHIGEPFVGVHGILSGALAFGSYDQRTG